MMMGFGMVFGGLTIWMKNIGQTTPLIQSVAMFFCGVYFPIAVLPEYLQPVADYMPFYYSIEGLRRSLMPISTGELMEYVWKLLLFAVAFILLGLFALRKGLKKVQKHGSLAFY